MFVYMIVNRVNGKYYIGKTKQQNLDRYWSHQKSRIFGPRARNQKPHLYNAVRKHGWDNFTIHPLMPTLTTNEQLCYWERWLISLLQAQDPNIGYNITAGGEGITMTAGTAAKISSTMKERRIRPVTKGKSIQAQYPLPERKEMARRRKIAATMKGRSPKYALPSVPWNKAGTHSEEARAKMRKSHAGLAWSPARRAAFEKKKAVAIELSLPL